MQIGYNNDVEYRDKTFHIQTEDRGTTSASIETQIYHKGAILDTSIISYDKVLAATQDIDERIAKIRALMQGNHKKLYKRLFAGDYDEMVGLKPLTDRPVNAIPEFEPGHDGVPAAALEIERGNIQSLGDEYDGGMDLAALQAQLNADAELAGNEVSEPPTMALGGADLLDIATTQETPAIRPNGAFKVEFPKTGARAWRGCDAMRSDADITSLVEEFA